MDSIYHDYACVPKPVPTDPGCVIREVPMGAAAPEVMHLACTVWVGGAAFFGLIVTNRIPSLAELDLMQTLSPTLFSPVATT